MFYVYVATFFFTFLLIWIVRYYAKNIGLIDIPNDRSIHVAYRPRGAGVAFYLAVMLTISVFYSDVFLLFVWTFIAMSLIFFMGLWDDIDDISPRMKFLIIIISTIFLFFDGIIIENLGTFFSIDISLYWFALPFMIFVVSGFTNALNLIDGLDGLASSISLVILGSFFYIGSVHSDIFIMLISGIFIAILLAFLFYNWFPATIFMGDSGSLLLGFTISILGIKSLSYIPAVSILYLGAIPILDTLVVMIRRKRAGRSFFSADACHMHHLLYELFNSNTQKTVLFLAGCQLLYSLFGLQLDKEMDQGFLLIVFVLNILILYIIFGKMIEKQKRNC